MADEKPKPAPSPAPSGSRPVQKPAASPAEAERPEPFTADEIKAFAGDLKNGEVGYVELNEDGEPTGAAKREVPEPGKQYARVVSRRRIEEDEATTPTGAPITRHMNPAPDLWDEGILARNPPPK